MVSKQKIIELAKECGYQHPDAVGTCEDFAYFDVYSFYNAAYEAKLREEKPIYQVWRSTDNCNEFYSWDDCDKSDYDLASDEDRRILFEHPAPSAPEGWQLVPIEPTEAMILAINSMNSPKNCYKALLAAARSGNDT